MKLHPDASNSAKKAFNTLEERFRYVHKDMYDYSECVYLNSDTKIKIYCTKHKLYFETTPTNHLIRGRCPECKVEYKREKCGTTRTKEDFIKLAKEKLPQYDYSKVEYINANTKILVVCTKHGEFTTIPSAILNGIQCKECATIQRGLTHRNTFQEFLEKANKVHNNAYTYIEDSYTKTSDKVEVICKYHGHYKVNVGSHLAGVKCPECAKIQRGLKRRVSFEDFEKQASERYNNKFTYIKESYVSLSRHMDIICPKHGKFTTRPQKHLKGTYGCEGCAREMTKLSWFDKPTTLYYIKIQKSGKDYYKIGITTKSVERRFKHFNKNKDIQIETIATALFESGKDPFRIEQEILKEFEEYRTKDEVLNIRDRTEGNSEILDIDIFPYIKHHFKQN